MVADDKYHDPSVYPDPLRFNVERFLRLRQNPDRPGAESKYQFVTTSPEHMGFGHGQHACPGRFFASNEMKIALSFLLLRYDMRFVPNPDGSPGQRPEEMAFEVQKLTKPGLKIQIRRREEEIDVANPIKSTSQLLR